MSKHIGISPLEAAHRLAPLPRHVVKIVGERLFAERLLYVDWMEGRALS